MTKNRKKVFAAQDGLLSKLLFSCLLFTSSLSAIPPKEENRKIRAYGKRVVELYNLDKGQEFQEITQRLLDSSLVPAQTKDIIRHQGRKYFLFSYLSGPHKVKGYLSIPGNMSPDTPLTVLLRGGNRDFGLMSIANNFSYPESMAVAGLTYRGAGGSEGEDEFGGGDVEDVYRLAEHLPNVYREIDLEFAPSKKYMVGTSRGGMRLS